MVWNLVAESRNSHTTCTTHCFRNPSQVQKIDFLWHVRLRNFYKKSIGLIIARLKNFSKKFLAGMETSAFQY